jgi:hypothetical protein
MENNMLDKQDNFKMEKEQDIKTDLKNIYINLIMVLDVLYYNKLYYKMVFKVLMYNFYKQ